MTARRLGPVVQSSSIQDHCKTKFESEPLCSIQGEKLDSFLPIKDKVENGQFAALSTNQDRNSLSLKIKANKHKYILYKMITLDRPTCI